MINVLVYFADNATTDILAETGSFDAELSEHFTFNYMREVNDPTYSLDISQLMGNVATSNVELYKKAVIVEYVEKNVKPDRRLLNPPSPVLGYADQNGNIVTQTVDNFCEV